MSTQKAGHNPATFTFFFLRMNKVYFQGKFGLGIQNEAGQRLIEFRQENALVITNTLFQKHKRRLYTWKLPHSSTPESDGFYSLQPKMEKLYTVNNNKTRS